MGLRIFQIQGVKFGYLPGMEGTAFTIRGKAENGKPVLFSMSPEEAGNLLKSAQIEDSHSLVGKLGKISWEDKKPDEQTFDGLIPFDLPPEEVVEEAAPVPVTGKKPTVKMGK